MTVHELNSEELEELRLATAYELMDNVSDVSNDILFKRYEGMSFVKEDFFCNL